MPAAVASPGVSSVGAARGTWVDGLTVEHRTDPVGVDTAVPRLGWKLRSDGRGQKQTGYRILVATSPDRLTVRRADVWNSGRIPSSDSVAVVYGGRSLTPSTTYYWNVEVWDKDGKALAVSASARFETGLMSADGVTNWSGAKWISMAGKEPNSPGAPMFRQQARLTGEKVLSARLYISSLGVFDAAINGKKVGVVGSDGRTSYELLTPGWTNYDTTVNYMSYDVTSLIAGTDDVAVAATLGNGWYNSRISAAFVDGVGGSTYYSEDGNPLALKAKLLIRFSDGSTQTVVTDTRSGWAATDTGPHRADDIYDGEMYDATRELDGWTSNGFDDSGWSGVVEHPWARTFPGSKLLAYNGETARLVDRWDRSPESITVYTGVTDEESSRNGRGRIVVDAGRSVTDGAADASVTLGPGDTAIYDLGQNMVGVPSFTVRGEPGTRITVRFGEMLNDDSAGADGPAGSVYFANLRTAKQTSTYTLKGAANGETHQDSMSFYGFRYASVSVATPGASVEIVELTGKVATSAIHDIGSIRTNDADINQLYSNVRWGQRGNYLWVPTDCPQRDERQGWTGDTQLFANTALYNADAVNFLENFQDMLVDSQSTYGVDGAAFTATSPGGKFAVPVGGLSGWGDAGVIIPWTVWQMSGDTAVIERNYAAMTRYMDWMFKQTGLTYAGPGALFGDWLAFQKTSTQYMSDVYYAYDAKLMADMARATGRSGDVVKYDDLFGNIKRAFVTKYIGKNLDGSLVVRSSLGLASPVEPGSTPNPVAEDNTQTALLWALKLGLYADENQRRQMIELLTANVENTAAYKAANPLSSRASYPPNTLSVGFLGVNVLAPVLTDSGRADLAYKLLLQDAMPSWLYSVANGATTVWERWNSYSNEDGFGPVDMNSFNHYSYGAIAEWMYEDMAGIGKDTANPGFKHFVLQPTVDPTARITTVDASYESPYGLIESSWTVAGNAFDYHVRVPANSTATVHIPTADPSSLTEGGRPIAESAGARYVGYRDGEATYELDSGSYDLRAMLR